MEVVDLVNIVSKDFAKLGCNSLEGISNLSLSSCKSERSYTDNVDRELEIEIGADLKNQPIRVQKVDDETTIFGIDTSNIMLGNTERGILSAVRGAIVWRSNARYRYVRYGPFIFHITERNRYWLYNTLRQIYLDTDDGVGAPILERTVEQIRSILERWLQKQICESTSDSLILWDGPLTTKTINGSISVLGDILHVARRNRNRILAFSKHTTFTIMGRRLNNLIADKFTPCLLDIDDAVRVQYGNHLHFFGKIYAAKLSENSLTFRVDIDRRNSDDDRLTALSKLLGNELLADGYPESLRLAHILSRFSLSEVLAMQRYVATNYGLQIEPELDIRQTLFGPYGGSGHIRLDRYDAGL